MIIHKQVIRGRRSTQRARARAYAADLQSEELKLELEKGRLEVRIAETKQAHLAKALSAANGDVKDKVIILAKMKRESTLALNQMIEAKKRLTDIQEAGEHWKLKSITENSRATVELESVNKKLKEEIEVGKAAQKDTKKMKDSILHIEALKSTHAAAMDQAGKKIREMAATGLSLVHERTLLQKDLRGMQIHYDSEFSRIQGLQRAEVAMLTKAAGADGGTLQQDIVLQAALREAEKSRAEANLAYSEVGRITLELNRMKRATVADPARSRGSTEYGTLVRSSNATGKLYFGVWSGIIKLM